jgi:hypothetical protein
MLLHDEPPRTQQFLRCDQGFIGRQLRLIQP